MTSLLFVYGKLKKDFSAHYVIEELNYFYKYLGVAKTTPSYGMYTFRVSPAMIDRTRAEKLKVDAKSSIFGELYEVEDRNFIKLDSFEGVEHNQFSRMQITLDSVTLSHLPISQNAFSSIAAKTAYAYIFQKDLEGVDDCSPIWTLNLDWQPAYQKSDS